MYDKLVMQYAFKENILKKQQNDYDGGSELFTPTLTTNGLCYSFNSENYSSVWKESEVTNTFNELFPHNSSAGFFQGAEVTDGEILIQVFLLINKLNQTFYIAEILIVSSQVIAVGKRYV